MLRYVPLRQENILPIKLAALVRRSKFRDVKTKIMKEIYLHTCCWRETNPFKRSLSQSGGDGTGL